MSMEMIPRLLIFVNAGLAILCLLVGLVVYQINKTKGLVSILLALVFSAVVGYYCYLSFFETSKLSTGMTAGLKTGPVTVSPGQSPIMVKIETEDGSQLNVEDGDYLDVKSNVAIKITGVFQNGNQVENVRVNVIGFAPADNPGTKNDTGYLFSYKDMIRKFAIDDEKTTYKVEIKKNDGSSLGEVYLRFIK